MSTRRQFLTVTTAAALASTLPRNAFASPLQEEDVFSNRNLGAFSQGLLTLATFQQLVGAQFRVFLADGSVAYLTLVTVTDRNAATSSAGPKGIASQSRTAAATSALRAAPATSAFDLEFIAKGRALEQQSYTVDHARLGRFAALLVPGRKTNAGSTYTMSFNYLSGAAASSGPAKGQFLTQPQLALSTMVR